MNDLSPAAPLVCAGPRRDVRRPALALPPNATDAHAHLFGPVAGYPYAANRFYTPPPVFLDDYLAMHRAVGFERGVLVQTGLYGNDNSGCAHLRCHRGAEFCAMVARGVEGDGDGWTQHR